MAMIRLLIVSQLVDNRTNETIHTAIRITHAPKGREFDHTFKDNPVEGYSLKIKIYDTYVQKRMDEYLANGAQLLPI